MLPNTVDLCAGSYLSRCSLELVTSAEHLLCVSIQTHLSVTQLGTVDADKHVDFSLTVCPVRLGLVTIGRLQLTDVFVKQTYNFTDFVQVFVVDEQYRDDDMFEMDKYVQYGMEKPAATTAAAAAAS